METRPGNFVWFAIAVRFVTRVAGVRFQRAAVEGQMVQTMAGMIVNAVARLAEAVLAIARLAGSVVTIPMLAGKAGFPVTQKPPLVGGIMQPFTGNVQGHTADLADRYQDSQGQMRNRC